MGIVRLIGILAFLLVGTGEAAADTVHLTNGDVITGDIVELIDDEIVFNIELSDEVHIDLENIAYIETSRPFSIQYDDGTEVTGYVVMEDGQMVLRAKLPEKADKETEEQVVPPAAPDAPETTAAVDEADADAAKDLVPAAVDVAAPGVADVPAETLEKDAVVDALEVVDDDGDLSKHEEAVVASVMESDGRVVTLDDLFRLEAVETYFRYEAEVEVGINVSKGNTDQSSFNVGGRVEPSFGKNTVRLGGQLNRTEADGETTASNWRIEAAYEREFTRRWRAIALNRYENDKFQDLDLRVTAAAGPGYSIFLDNPSLEIFLAPAYVHEAFKSDSSRDFAALLWGLEFEYAIPKPDLTFYHNHSLTVGVTESQNVLLTTTGFKWDIIGDLDLKLEYAVNWNSKPADDAESVDQRYMLKISYEFEGDQTDWFH